MSYGSTVCVVAPRVHMLPFGDRHTVVEPTGHRDHTHSCARRVIRNSDHKWASAVPLSAEIKVGVPTGTWLAPASHGSHDAAQHTLQGLALPECASLPSCHTCPQA